MKAVMLSIQPKWIELIASGKKTVEVRKTKPKIDVPFKCYIYETKGKSRWCNRCKNTDCERPYPNCACWEGQGKVIGEFVCDWVVDSPIWRLRGNTGFLAPRTEKEKNLPEMACLSLDELKAYVGSENKCVCGWHITDLVIYDKPKELSEFRKICQSDYCHTCDYAVKKNGYLVDCDRSVKRPPQSWCYVEEILPPLVEPKGKTITIPKWTYNEHKGESE